MSNITHICTVEAYNMLGRTRFKTKLDRIFENVNSPAKESACHNVIITYVCIYHCILGYGQYKPERQTCISTPGNALMPYCFMISHPNAELNFMLLQ